MQLLQDNSDRHFLHSMMLPEVVQLYERSLTVRGIKRVGDEGHFRIVSEKTLPDEIMLKLRDWAVIGPELIYSVLLCPTLADEDD